MNSLNENLTINISDNLNELPDDVMIDIQDILLVLSVILEDSDSITLCQLSDADFNGNRVININDIIGMVGIIIGN